MSPVVMLVELMSSTWTLVYCPVKLGCSAATAAATVWLVPLLKSPVKLVVAVVAGR